MTPESRITLIRAAVFFVPACVSLFLGTWRRLGRLDAAAIILAGTWNFAALSLVNLLALHLGWWRFHVYGGTLFSIPVDLLIGWSLLWSIIPILGMPRVPLVMVIAILACVDILFMPHMQPVVLLQARWLVGEGVALLISLLPGLILARFTQRQEHLYVRATMQVVLFGALILVFLPNVILSLSHRSWRPVGQYSSWQLAGLLGLVLLISTPGIAAVQEFAERGGGTPLPYDPPQRLVTSGLYRYVANPMQLSTVLVLLVLGLILQSPLVAAGALIAAAYSLGLAAHDESRTMQRFGDAYVRYRRSVRNFIPSRRPYVENAACVYIADSCAHCRQLRRWIESLKPTGLGIEAAESHSTRVLMRITYDSMDGSPEVTGIAAVGRVLEHISLPLAIAGSLLRLPGVCGMATLLTDACGPGPHRVVSQRQ